MCSLRGKLHGESGKGYEQRVHFGWKEDGRREAGSKCRRVCRLYGRKVKGSSPGGSAKGRTGQVWGGMGTQRRIILCQRTQGSHPGCGITIYSHKDRRSFQSGRWGITISEADNELQGVAKSIEGTVTGIGTLE